MKKAVLIVEDNADQLNMLTQLVLEVNGNTEVYTAQNAGRAYEILMDKTVDVFLIDIILDVNKPGDASGIKLVEKLRQIPKYFFAPVIFITSMEDQEMHAYRNLNCFGYIEKPYHSAQVREKVERALHFTTERDKDITLPLKKDNILHPVRLNDIVYMESIGHVMQIHVRNGEVLEIPYLTCKRILEGEDVFHIGVQLHLRQLSRLSAELEVNLFEMIEVDVGVPRGVDEFARLQPAHLSYHHRQQGIGSDVEWNSEECVRAALVQLAGEPSVGDIELEETVAGRQGHAVHFAWIPGGHYHPPRVGVLPYCAYDLAQLVYAPAVRSRPASPLMPVHGTQVPVLIRPLVPDADSVLLEVGDVGVARDEPQQFVDYGLEVDLLGGEQREALLQVKAHLVSEHALGADTGAVVLYGAVFSDVSEQPEVLFHRLKC